VQQQHNFQRAHGTWDEVEAWAATGFAPVHRMLHKRRDLSLSQLDANISYRQANCGKKTLNLHSENNDVVFVSLCQTLFQFYGSIAIFFYHIVVY
jgi:hypothetical protein